MVNLNQTMQPRINDRLINRVVRKLLQQCVEYGLRLTVAPCERRLGRGSDGRFGLRRFRAKLTPTPFGTHSAFTHALPILRASFCPFHRSALFLPAAAQVKEETSPKRQKDGMRRR